MPWPPPLSARWTALALFLLAITLHLFLALGGTFLGVDFKLLIVIDELGAILLTPVLFAFLLGIRLRDAFLFRSAHWSHYAVAGAMAIPLQLLAGTMQEILLQLLPQGDAYRDLLERAMEPLLRTDGPADLALLLFGGVVLAAVCEEILFRGLLLQLLARGGRWWFAINVSAVLFAVFHLDFIGLLPRTIMGIYLGLLVLRSGSIFPAMLAHAANNLLAFAAAPLVDAGQAATPTLQEVLLLALAAGAGCTLVLGIYLRFTPALPAPETAGPAPPAAGDDIAGFDAADDIAESSAGDGIVESDAPDR